MIREKANNQQDSDTRDWAAAGEHSLWQAVITGAIDEWLHGPLRQRREAERYLFEDQQDFPTVCRSAGMDAEYLRSKLNKMRQQNPGLECMRPMAA